ncbi:MAG: TlpA family protein disulfide reductase [Rhizobiales bacterium]|nr:TlpA family protein disulfide reductase [Hyphomicrobiales bacterium]
MPASSSAAAQAVPSRPLHPGPGIGPTLRHALAALLLTLALIPPADAFNFVATDAGPVPEVTFLDADGHERSLSEFQGRVVVLNLWATWCAPCRKEMPSLDRLQQTLGGADLEVIALAVDRGDLARVLDFYREVGVETLAVYHDSSAKAGRTLRAPGLPTTLIIDRKGDEVGRVLGDAEWDGEDVIALLKAVIAEDQP